MPARSVNTREREAVARAIRAAREAASLTQAEFARQIGATVRAVQSWEQGQRLPSAAMMARIEGLRP